MSREPWFSDFLTIPHSFCSSPFLCPSLRGFLSLARKGCETDILFQAEHSILFRQMTYLMYTSRLPDLLSKAVRLSCSRVSLSVCKKAHATTTICRVGTLFSVFHAARRNGAEVAWGLGAMEENFASSVLLRSSSDTRRLPGFHRSLCFM